MSICNLKELPSSKARGESEEENSRVAKGLEEWSVLSVSEESEIEESEDESSLFSSGRKRVSLSEVQESSSGKRIKMEVDKKRMSDEEEYVSGILKIEQDLERNRRNEPFKRRNLNAILEELDLIGTKWKEGYSQHALPIRWGSSISKNCSEKWDSHYIPQKLYERYQRIFKGNQPEPQYQARRSDVDVSEFENEMKGIEGNSEGECTDGVDEEATEALSYDCYQQSEENSDTPARTRSRNKNQNRGGMDERMSNENGGDQSARGKQSKKGYSKGKREQPLLNETRRAVVELQRCADPYAKLENNENSDSNKNFEKMKREDSASPLSSPVVASKHYEDKSNVGGIRINEEERVTCPICDDNFEKDQIEEHAMQCARITYQD
ncbi:UNVERIFIED_CONTAM: hypothetical protein PYX00_007633 [Menopon gallinae]|uniref:UBZ4-type domain-containing protein n=1 Tax=Menopon gallinae TaxID=328185 RepID=A0AAW2HK47_9NEOP